MEGAMKDLTYEKLRALELWLQRLYSNAESEMRVKWDKYLARQEKRAETLLSRVRDAKTDKERAAAEMAYKSFLKSKIAGDKNYRNMVQELAREYSRTNERALEIINGKRAEFFADGYNLSADRINDVAVHKDIGIRFDLVDKDTVEWLAKNRERNLMPPPDKLKIPEDERWNAKLINSQVTQGIIQGESIPKIAARISNVTDGDLKASVRRARTMATGCENAGRVQSMKTAENWGVQTRKKWVCTHDGRTRDTHTLLDGEKIGVDGVFWNGCRYPGDHLGPPREVWNCRCTLITVVDGFSSNLPKGKENAVHVTVDGEEVTPYVTATTSTARNVVQGKDLTGIFRRRVQEFEFEIDDVLDAQGFNGLPRVVVTNEFEEAVRNANNGNGFIAQRTYSAPNQETLDAYRDQLYNGKWYVDCSVGGSALGKGMYSVYNNGTQITEYMEREMRGYGARRGAEYNYIETFTLTPDAKTISPEEIAKLRNRMQSDIMSGIGDRGGWGNKDALKWAEEQGSILNLDDGSFAAALGYDAILSSGVDNYAVILNRTKMIIKEP
jgi:uncharacterized protein with gpF-like domain